MKFSTFLLVFILFFLFSCENETKKCVQIKISQTDTTREVNLYRNSRLGNISAKKLGINLLSDGNYDDLKKQIKIERKELLKLYNQSIDKQKIIDSTKKYLINTLLNKILPFWYGTNWSLSGYSDIPNYGEVGCSYLVSNTLKHLDFNINRFKVGQAASLYIAKTFQLSDEIIEISDFSNKEMFEYVKKNLQEGFYIVGLDYHVGYLLFYSDEVFFVHSSFIYPGTVVIEYAEFSPGFNSRLHVIGEITTNDSLIVKWLENSFIPVLQ